MPLVPKKEHPRRIMFGLEAGIRVPLPVHHSAKLTPSLLPFFGSLYLSTGYCNRAENGYNVSSNFWIKSSWATLNIGGRRTDKPSNCQARFHPPPGLPYFLTRILVRAAILRQEKRRPSSWPLGRILWELQGSAKEWSLGCVIPASWLPLAAGARFTQPRDHCLADPCTGLPAYSDH